MERDKKRELEKLVAEREALRKQEESMLEDIKRMEMNLVEQERHF